MEQDTKQPSRFLADPEEIEFTEVPKKQQTKDIKNTKPTHAKIRSSPFRKRE